MNLPCSLKLRHTGSSNHGRGGEGAMITENLSCTLAASVQDQTLFTGGMSAIGFMAEPSAKTRSIGAEMEVSPCLNAEGGGKCTAYGINPQGGGMNPFDRELGETQSVCHQGGVMQVNENDLLKMRYIVRRLTPTEAERLMGLPDGYTIPRGLRITDELVAEFQRIHDTFGAIMAEYEHKPAPKPKSASQVRAWLEKITDPATCPDSPRYKGCGNGWATNQPRWILTRLLAIGEGIDPFTGEDEP